jgi:DNA transformation protein
MVASNAFADFLREQFAPIGRVTLRRMFGKTGVFYDGVMFGMVTENTLYFRVDAQNRVTFKEAEAFPPLNYEKRGHTIDLSFWRAPERLFDEPDELIAWARAALEAARRLRRSENGQRRNGHQSLDEREGKVPIEVQRRLRIGAHLQQASAGNEAWR